jgi:hypothetical protein
MDVNEFAEFVFVKNVNDVLVELSLGGVENNLDLFCFLVDLMCKGLVFLFGGPSKKVILDSISMQDFEKIRHKMSLAGIKINLNLQPNDSNMPVCMNVADFAQFPPNDPLESYKFKLTTLAYLFVISFEIVRLPEVAPRQ